MALDELAEENDRAYPVLVRDQQMELDTAREMEMLKALLA